MHTSITPPPLASYVHVRTSCSHHKSIRIWLHYSRSEVLSYKIHSTHLLSPLIATLQPINLLLLLLVSELLTKKIHFFPIHYQILFIKPTTLIFISKIYRIRVSLPSQRHCCWGLYCCRNAPPLHEFSIFYFLNVLSFYTSADLSLWLDLRYNHSYRRSSTANGRRREFSGRKILSFPMSQRRIFEVDD